MQRSLCLICDNLTALIIRSDIYSKIKTKLNVQCGSKLRPKKIVGELHLQFIVGCGRREKWKVSQRERTIWFLLNFFRKLESNQTRDFYTKLTNACALYQLIQSSIRLVNRHTDRRTGRNGLSVKPRIIL